MAQALEEAKTRDRLFVASKYQLFTLNQVRQVRARLPPVQASCTQYHPHGSRSCTELVAQLGACHTLLHG